jgi:hypothetical protein
MSNASNNACQPPRGRDPKPTSHAQGARLQLHKTTYARYIKRLSNYNVIRNHRYNCFLVRTRSQGLRTRKLFCATGSTAVRLLPQKRHITAIKHADLPSGFMMRTSVVCIEQSSLCHSRQTKSLPDFKAEAKSRSGGIVITT